jgi:gliding motility-associated-like protein
MKKGIKLLSRIGVLLLVLLLFGNQSKGQLFVDASLSPDSLAKLISGEGVQIFNAQVNCGTNGYGKYNATGTTLGVNEGLLLTTGTVYNAIGPNNVGNKSTNWTNPYDGNPQTYPLLNNYTGRTTYEYCEFEFDIVPQGDTISFDFVFASEEYQEWVGSQYNDVFGFFISGPGIVPDAGAGVFKNIALIPNTSTPVTINNVNQNLNTTYYQNNNNGQHVQYDGYTRGLTAISNVVPCQTYHLKLVVADASDKIYDSGVFIEKIKSNNILLLSSTAGNLPHMVEGCNDGVVTFKRPLGSPNISPLLIQYWLDGTATNGTDYNLIGSDPNPLVPKTITIPSGIDSVNLPITTIADGLAEISEYIMVYLGNPFCSNSITDSLQFFIQDSLFSTASPLNDSICIGSSVQLQSTGGSIFSWTPTSTLNNASIANPIATPAATTTYTLSTSASFCVENKNVKINVSDINLTLTPTNVSCNGNNNGTVSVAVTNGLTPYVYSWTGPNGFISSVKNISNLAPGTYTLAVVDAKGCTKSKNITITEPTVLNSTITSNTYNGGYNISCYGLNDGSIVLSPSGGTLPYSYVWVGPSGFSASSQNISGLVAGTYSVVITDAKGCVRNKSITLTQPSQLVASITSSNNVNCKGDASGSALVSVQGGTPTYTYSWNTSPVQTLPVANSLYAGSYLVTVTDKNGCVDTSAVTIAEPSSNLSASITSTSQVLCKGDSTGSATVVAIGGTSPYFYNWNSTPSQTMATATNLPAGNFNVLITDNKGCSTSLPITITEPQFALNVSITDSDDVLCKGQSNGQASAIASGGSGSYSYSWNTTPIQNTATASNLVAGNYTVMVSDNNGCTKPSTANLTINEPLLDLSSSLTVSNFTGGVNISCNGAADGTIDQTIVGGTSPYTISWSGDNGFTSTNEDISSLDVGNYYLNITDANGCKYVDTTELIQPTLINVEVITSFATCPSFSNGTILINVTGGSTPYNFSWTGPSGFTSSNEDIVGLAAGNYNLTLTDANGCLKSITVTVSQPGTLTLSNSTSTYIGGNNISCNGFADGSINLTPAGGVGVYNYLWTGPNGFTSTNEDISGLEAGAYQVILSDVNGCFLSDSIYLSEPNIVSASLTPSLFNGNNNITCNGVNDGSVTTVVTGGIAPYDYSWTGTGAFLSSNQNINSLVAGTYNLTVTDTNGCIGTKSITLVEPDSLIGITSSPTYNGNNNISCFGLSNGSANLTTAGGTSPLTYSWNGPSGYTSTLEDITNIGAGSYSVQIMDNNGCIDSSFITLVQPDSLLLSGVNTLFNGGFGVSCNGYSNGGIDLTVLGGTTPYTYNWSNGSSNQDLTSIQAGSFSVIVTDANNCSSNLSSTITQPPLLQSGITSPTFIGGNNVSCSGVADGAIDLQVVGGTPSYTYSWVGPNGFMSSVQDLNTLVAGTYQVTITDTNNCSKNDFYTLTEPSVLALNLSSPTFVGGYNLSCNNNSTGVINLSVSGGIPTYQYSWTGVNSYSSTSQNIENLVAGEYIVTITDTNSCIGVDTLTITEPLAISSSALLSDFNGFNVGCFESSDGSIDLTVVGGNVNYQYLWTNNDGFSAASEDISSLFAGEYYVNITDTNGCKYDTTITLTQPQQIIDSLYVPTYFGGYNVSCNESSDGTITSFTVGGVSPFNYNWSGPNGFSSNDSNLTNLVAGTYYYSFTDDNGCVINDSITLTEPDTLKSYLTTTVFASGDNIACKGDTTGVIFTAVSGGNVNYNFNWSNSTGYNSDIQSPDNLLAGTYYLVLTDTNGCVWNDSIILTEPTSVINASITPSIFPSGDNISCFGDNNGTLEVSPTGGTPGYIIDWRGPNGYSSIDSAIDSLFAGVYDVAIIDSNGCSIGLTYELVQPDTFLSLNENILTYPNGLNLSCNKSNDGEISIAPQGGSLPYTYNWTSSTGFNSSNEDVLGLSEGVYYIQLTDVNNCNVSDTFNITEPDSMVINSVITPTICGNPIGSINLFVQGYSPFSYEWTNADTMSFISNLSSGNYGVIITDVYGCKDSATYIIDDLINSIAIDLYSSEYNGGHNISQNNGSDGSIDMTILGGTSPYNVLWSNGLTDEDLYNLTAGNYSVTVSDINGCESYANIILTEPLPLEMPTAITPNDDGKNDYFFVRGLEAYPDNSILIFNRWGNEVFSQDDYANDWNGVNKSGAELPEGTYFVILKITSQNIELKGYIDIRR